MISAMVATTQPLNNGQMHRAARRQQRPVVKSLRLQYQRPGDDQHQVKPEIRVERNAPASGSRYSMIAGLERRFHASQKPTPKKQASSAC